jgi:hypothetical protein
VQIAKYRKHIFLTVATCSVVAIGIFAWLNEDNTSSAADARNFNASNIMSDFVMTNKSSMSEAQIQAFLSSKNPCNDRNISKAAAYPNIKYNIKDGKFVCLAEESFDGESAARIIWQAAQDYNINPQVLIALLEKEQGLITDTWPNHIQYRSATGYGCPDTADCDSKYYGFKNQVRNAANFFRAYQTGNTGWYKLVWPGNKYTGAWQPFDYSLQYHPNTGCGSVSTRIENRATASLYSYTPYRPNQAALNAQSGEGDGCSSYGNRNFWMFFNKWFGDTSGAFIGGVDYSPVFDSEYYMSNNPDIKSATGGSTHLALQHFVNYGMNEGRQGTLDFNVITYRNRYADLRSMFRNNLTSYYRHYLLYGLGEGRTANGSQTLVPISSLGGKTYSSVYQYDSYLSKNPDINRKYSGDDIGALEHFVNYGMSEGRVASDLFDINSYREGYRDLRLAFGDNLKLFFMHYIDIGKNEGRQGVNNEASGTSTLNGVNYSGIYNFNYYRNNYSDIKNAFALNDTAALSHFVRYGMSEGRQATASFNVTYYINRYGDLRNAFGNNLQRYYMHYIQHGIQEGRIGTNTNTP